MFRTSKEFAPGRWLRTTSLGLTLVAGLTGCRSPCGEVEAALREREGQLAEIRDELDRSTIYNQSLLHELATLRGDIPAGADGPVAAYPVKTLVLGRQSGGRSSDGCAGDDSLQVVVEPRDCDDQAIKAPGALIVQAYEITSEGLKTPLSSWEIPPEQLRRSWRSGLFTTGYVLTLPWKVWPNNEKLRVVAQLRLLDGRVFEADRDLTIRVTPVASRRSLPALVEPPASGSQPVKPPASGSQPVKPPAALPTETAPPPRPIPEGPAVSEGAGTPDKLPLLPPPAQLDSDAQGAAVKPPPPAMLNVTRPATQSTKSAPPTASAPPAPSDVGPIPSSAWKSDPAPEPPCSATILRPEPRGR